MQKLHFSIKINAPVEKVWKTMFDDKTYRVWASAFSEGGYYEGSWEKGSKILFLGPDKEGNVSGMVSMIAENKPNEFISIKHLGFVQNGVEDTTSEKIKDWVGALENYTFKETDGVTEIIVDIDVVESFVPEFSKMWPEALQKLKQLAEQ
jgi:translation elongation factor EF-4